MNEQNSPESGPHHDDARLNRAIFIGFMVIVGSLLAILTFGALG